MGTLCRGHPRPASKPLQTGMMRAVMAIGKPERLAVPTSSGSRKTQRLELPGPASWLVSYLLRDFETTSSEPSLVIRNVSFPGLGDSSDTMQVTACRELSTRRCLFSH